MRVSPRTLTTFAATNLGNLGDRWEDYLAEDEKQLWTGAPTLRFKFSWWYLPAVPIGGFFLFAVLFHIFEKSITGMQREWSIVLILLGVSAGVALFGQPWWEAQRRAKQRYALTSRRAMISIGWWPYKRVLAWEIGSTFRFDLIDSTPESIIFCRIWIFFKIFEFGFEFIPDGRRVYEMMRDIQASQGALA